MRGLWSVLVGLVMIIGGASGQLALRGTNSSTALIVVGVCVLAFGGYQLIADWRKKQAAAASSNQENKPQ